MYKHRLPSLNAYGCCHLPFLSLPSPPLPSSSLSFSLSIFLFPPFLLFSLLSLFLSFPLYLSPSYAHKHSHTQTVKKFVRATAKQTNRSSRVEKPKPIDKHYRLQKYKNMYKNERTKRSPAMCLLLWVRVCVCARACYCEQKHDGSCASMRKRTDHKKNYDSDRRPNCERNGKIRTQNECSTAHCRECTGNRTAPSAHGGIANVVRCTLCALPIDAPRSFTHGSGLSSLLRFSPEKSSLFVFILAIHNSQVHLCRTHEQCEISSSSQTLVDRNTRTCIRHAANGARQSTVYTVPEQPLHIHIILLHVFLFVFYAFHLVRLNMYLYIQIVFVLCAHRQHRRRRRRRRRRQRQM